MDFTNLGRSRKDMKNQIIFWKMNSRKEIQISWLGIKNIILCLGEPDLPPHSKTPPTLEYFEDFWKNNFKMEEKAYFGTKMEEKCILGHILASKIL